MMQYRKTPAVARQLGVSYWRLFGLLRTGRLTPPDKDSSGDYVWTDQDVASAQQLLRTNEAQPITPGAKQQP